MDHHFVPQFYLDAFCDPATPEGQDPWVWVADLKERTIRRKAPKNVASRSDYYAIPDSTGEKTHAIEEMFSRIESDAAPIVARLLRGEFDLSVKDRAALGHLMAAMATRGPSFRENIERFLAEVARKVLLVSAQFDPDFLKVQSTKDLSDEEIEKARQMILAGDWEVTAKPVASLMPVLESAAIILPILCQMEWAFFVAYESSSFLTCDTPLSWVAPTLPPGPYGSGLAMRNVEVTFPIGPRVCFVGTWREGNSGSAPVDDEIVYQLNRRRVDFAHRTVFADSEAGAQQALEIASARGDDSARARPE